MAEIWYYTSEGKQMDPVSLSELRALARDGELKPTDMVWKDGMPRWIRASAATELFPDSGSSIDKYFNTPTSADSAPATPAPAAPQTNETVPLQDADDRPRAKRRPSNDEDDDDRPRSKKRRMDEDEDDRPRRRRPAPAPTSNTGLVVGLVVGGGVLLLVAIIVVVVMVSSRANPRRINIPRPGIQPVRVNIPNVNPNPNAGVGAPQLGVQSTYTFQMRDGAEMKQAITLKPGVRYFITATSEPRAPDVDLYLEFNGRDVASDITEGPDSNLDYTAPPGPGVHQMRVVNLGPGSAITKVVVAEVVTKPEEKKTEEKEEPPPFGVVAGVGTESVRSLNAGADHSFKLQVRAGKTANIRVTTHQPRPVDARVELFIVRDRDGKMVASDETPGYNCSARVTSEQTEVYTIRIHNKSSGPVRCTISYN